MMLQNGSKVVIIGGGPAGCSCAIKLKQESIKRGLKVEVILFEGKNFDEHYNQCVGVLSPPLERMLKDELKLDLPEELIKQKIIAYQLRGRKKEIELKDLPAAEPTYTVRRSTLDIMLLERARCLGVQVFPSRATYAEIIEKGGGEVRVYSESSTIKADVLVCAFGLDEEMLAAIEHATKRTIAYRRPRHFINSFITKIEADEAFIRSRLGDKIYAFILDELPGVEFGAVTPKADHIIVNIAGADASSADMDHFLEHPQVKKLLPEEGMGALTYFKGKFPAAAAKNPYGDRFLCVGDVTGWMRPFKGKGINTALLTGVNAATTIVSHGFSKSALEVYRRSCSHLTEDYYYGLFVRKFCRLASKYRFLDGLISLGSTDQAFHRALFNSVSGHEDYKKIVKSILNLRCILKMGAAMLHFN